MYLETVTFKYILTVALPKHWGEYWKLSLMWKKIIKTQKHSVEPINKDTSRKKQVNNLQVDKTS